MDNLVGQRFYKLLVLQKVTGKRSSWICQCDCGNQKIFTTYQLLKEHRMSCGCMNDENRKLLGEYSYKHGDTNTHLYSVWCGMKDRCYNPHYKYYSRYGGRGIEVCEEWKNSYIAFRKWAFDHGYDPLKSGKDQSIDRIDTDGNYCPQNCKWSNQTEQVRNRSISKNFFFHGKQMNPYEFCKQFGITNKVFVYRRLKKGDSPTKILHDWRMINQSSDSFMTREEACKSYGVSKETIVKWIKSGKLKAVKAGTRWRIPRGQIV